MAYHTIEVRKLNRAAMHHAMRDNFPHQRLSYRVTVKGDKPFSRVGKQEP